MRRREGGREGEVIPRGTQGGGNQGMLLSQGHHTLHTREADLELNKGLREGVGVGEAGGWQLRGRTRCWLSMWWRRRRMGCRRGRSWSGPCTSGFRANGAAGLCCLARAVRASRLWRSSSPRRRWKEAAMGGCGWCLCCRRRVWSQTTWGCSVRALASLAFAMSHALSRLTAPDRDLRSLSEMEPSGVSVEVTKSCTNKDHCQSHAH